MERAMVRLTQWNNALIPGLEPARLGLRDSQMVRVALDTGDWLLRHDAKPRESVIVPPPRQTCDAGEAAHPR
jgi:hypothetical protein